MSSDQNINPGQHIGQSDAQRPMSDNWYPRPQPLFNPPNNMQFPHTGPYVDWPSVSSNIQFQQHPNPPTTFSIPTSFQNQPLYQQSSQASSQTYPFYHSPQNLQPHHRTQATLQPSVASTGGSKNWTSDEDLQLCRAWVRISEDPAIGVGQKRETFWSRVTNMFHKLMQEVCEQESGRNQSACQSRMNDLKGFCNKWSGICTQAFQQPASGSSLSDTEALARQMWEDVHKGKPFKHMACWQVLKDCPRWNGINKSVSQKSVDSTSQARVGSPHQPLDTHLPESAPVHVASNMDRSQTPITPTTEEGSTGCIDSMADRGATCTPILNGPASVDIVHPPGQRIAKTKHDRKKQKFSDAQAVASQTLRAGIATLQASANARLEKCREDKRATDVRNDQVLQEERRMQAQLHDCELTRNRYDIMNKLTATGEKLMAAVQKLDEFGHESMLTPNQQFQYDTTKKAVTIHKRQIAELEESLDRTQFKSPLRMEPLFNILRGTSQRRLDYDEDEVVLEDD